LIAVVLALRQLGRQAEARQELGEELRLDRGQRDMLPILGLIDVIEGRAGIEIVLPRRSFHRPAAR
jgi:hypothetical protein